MAAALILRQVIHEGRSLNVALSTFGDDLVVPRDKALVQELCFGVLRWRWKRWQCYLFANPSVAGIAIYIS